MPMPPEIVANPCMVQSQILALVNKWSLEALVKELQLVAQNHYYCKHIYTLCFSHSSLGFLKLENLQITAFSIINSFKKLFLKMTFVRGTKFTAFLWLRKNIVYC